MTAANTRRRALNFLARQQQADGSFKAWASPTLKPFTPSKSQATIFPTILILDALRSVAGAEAIVAKAAGYIAAQVSSQTSWNYWEQASAARDSEPYPDDFDDTACALAALRTTDPEQIGAFARLLVVSEVSAGGPYNTWLIDHHTYPQWHDVDVAVNANIGYILSQQGVQPSGLMRYLQDAIDNAFLQSKYYVGVAPTLYFLARWYEGPAKAQLQAQVIEACKHSNPASPLTNALLLSAASYLGISKSTISPDTLLKEVKNDHWLAEALYVDPNYNGKQHFGGSAELTTALVLQALALHDTPRAHVPLNQNNGVPIKGAARIRREALAYSSKDLRRRYTAVAHRVSQADVGQQIIMPATIIAEAGKWKLPRATLQNLNSASLNGWVAYTIYDDLMDGSGQLELLSIANVAHRRSYSQYCRALPDIYVFGKHVASAFDTMDTANAWELKHARARVDRAVLRVKQLPDYNDLQQLADRSWGHSLAASGVVLSVFGDIRNACFIALQNFFTQFLIARQLHDDAHDWEEDLRLGQLSSVVTMLLLQYGVTKKLNLDVALPDLRQHFWKQTISDVAELIYERLRRARQALAQCAAYMSIQELESWLRKLEDSTILAIKKRDETVAFMHGFGGSNVN